MYCLYFFCLIASVCGYGTLPEFLRPNVVRILNISSMAEVDVNTMVNISSNLSNTSLSDIENDHLIHALQLLNRERKKQERLITIQAQILQNLHLNRQPNITTSFFSEDEQLTYSKLVEKMNKVEENVADGLILMRSFYASCAIPNNTDKSSWDSNDGLRIFYDLPFNSYPSDVTIKTAILRLFKKTTDIINSQTINVQIYQYLKPLKFNRKERKRLVDSKPIRLDDKGWIQFNVALSLTHWFQHTNKNYGFSVEVEDEFRNKLNPNLYFDAMNCSSNIPPYHPFPNLVNLSGERILSQFLSNYTYPTLDLRTSERFRGIHSLVEDRVRRSADNSSSSCTGELEYVSFAEVGLDEYIVWPTGVVWTFCEGSCSVQPHNRESFFAHWIQRLFKVKKKNLESNCVVTRRESMPALLYDGENQVFETVLEDFVPTSCGCRPS
ncbi:bone morphogenetic protein 2-A [Parasteatoda tepidariorum]|uniref:bone morphogenetic protein 2-A n=1 Tax=Parasteatoda tepidariorum TaxID=114398 RepID=UPI00077F8126|nr:bone morphogenetic protein 2-A [Parasteatoda tepidariorum]